MPRSRGKSEHKASTKRAQKTRRGWVCCALARLAADGGVLEVLLVPELRRLGAHQRLIRERACPRAHTSASAQAASAGRTGTRAEGLRSKSQETKCEWVFAWVSARLLGASEDGHLAMQQEARLLEDAHLVEHNKCSDILQRILVDMMMS